MSVSFRGAVSRSIKKTMGLTLVALTCFISSPNYATRFNLPPENESILGNIGFATTGNGDTPASVASRFNIGMNAILAANPGVTERSVFEGNTSLKIATQFLLPPLPRHGIVINLPEMRMYYYPEGSSEVLTFPIGIGKVGKTIPITNTKVVRKVTDPVWIPPADIRLYNEERGINLPERMPPGPDNPLGPFAIYLQIPTYLIHSTIFPESIGRRASFGCIRMNESDIEQFFPLVQSGTPVVILNMPNKIGWEDNTLFLEAHPPLIEHSSVTTLDGTVSMIERNLPKNGVILVNWQIVAHLTQQPDGIPHMIGVRIR